MESEMRYRVPKYCIGDVKPYQKGENIFELFRKVAERVPEQIAVIAEDTEYTYAQVFEMAENAAAYFYSKGVQAGDRIALTGYRTVYTIAAIYGLMKLGAAYIPLESDYPTKRVTYILQDSGTDKLIVTSQDFEQEFDGVKEIPFYKGINLSCSPLPDSIQTIENPCCYIIYTSGTTGAPKGTPICSNDLLNLTFWYADEVELHENSCVLLLNAFGFDASVKNIFATLLTGCTLLLGSQNLFDIARILKIMQAFHPTVVNCVPRLFHAILEADREHGYHAISSLQYAVLGGERLDKSMIDVLYRDKPNSKLKILNVYGPTECTSVSTSMKYSLRELSECETVRIGRPIFNKRVYIMDSDGNLLPAGEMGELVISGVGIAQHYLHKKANEVFLPDPYYPEDLMYRSGDLGYYDETGNIVFCGRKDKQIKINGHRIELEEIIQTGLKCSGSVWFDVVLCAGERLVGFVKGTEDRSDEIRTAMKEWCMDYMVPAEVISIPEIPLTAHGKTDYEALKEIAETHRKSKKTTVTGGTQAILMEIWEQLLGQNHFGTDEKFFDVGGNSLQLFKMKMLIQEKTGKDVEIVQLLQAATIEAMANLIDHSSSQNKESKENIRGAVRPGTGVARNKLKERMELLKKRRSGTQESEFSIPQFKSLFEGLLGNRQSQMEDPEPFRAATATRERMQTDANNQIKLADVSSEVLENHISTRLFDPTKLVRFSDFSSVLSVLRARQDNLTKCFYPSAGGLYPLNAYVFIKAGRVEGMQAGMYYYVPSQHALIKTDCTEEITASDYFGSNQEMFHLSAFSVYLVYDSKANVPKYGGMGYAYGLIDAGVIAEAMYIQCHQMQTMGVCSIGDMNFDKLFKILHLHEWETPVHALEFGMKCGD